MNLYLEIKKIRRFGRLERVAPVESSWNIIFRFSHPFFFDF